MPSRVNPDKPAKLLLRVLWDASRGRRGVTRYTGPLGGMSVNKKWMLAASNLIIEPVGKHYEAVYNLFDNMGETGHFALRTGDRVSSEAGTVGMHWSFSVGSILSLLKYAHETNDHLLASRCEKVIIDEVALNNNFTYRGSIYIPAPRVKGKPIDGYRDLFTSMALTGVVPRKRSDYWTRPESIVVSTLRDLIQSGVWDRGLQERSSLQSDLPKLYLPISIQLLWDGGWIASIAKDERSIPQAKLEGICDWVRCSSGRMTWGNDWKKPVPDN